MIKSGIYREIRGCLDKQGIGFVNVKQGTKIEVSQHMCHG